jgi:hypothetical protein
MKKLYTHFIAVVFLLSGLAPLPGKAQIIWNFNTTAPSAGVPATLFASSITRGHNKGITDTLINNTASDYTGASGGNNAAAAARGGGYSPDSSTYFEFALTPKGGASMHITEIDFGARSTATGPITYEIRYDYDGYHDPLRTGSINNNSTWQVMTNALDATIEPNLPVTFRIYAYGNAGIAAAGTANWRIDDLKVTATADGGTANPTLTHSFLFGPLITTYGTPSPPDSTFISGSNLTGDIVLTHSENYEFSLDNIDYSAASITLPQTGGVVTPTRLYIRMYKGAPGGVVEGSVTLTSGATTAVINLSGVMNGVDLAHVKINQVYGGGGNSGATYTHDFIELFNPEDTALNLAGWTVQYASANGSNWTRTRLSGIIPPHSFFLIREANGAGGTTPLPAPDLLTTGADSIAMSATAGKVVLLFDTAATTGTDPMNYIDKVGYGAANGFETSPAPVLTNTTSDRRKVDGGDSNNNSTDFIADSPIPRNSTYTISPPKLFALTPVKGATGIPYNSKLIATFDKAVVKGSGQITILDKTSGSNAVLDVSSPRIIISSNTTVTIDTILASGKTYAIVISAGAFKDVYGNNFAGVLSDTVWTFTTFDGAVATTLPATFNFQTCTGTGLLPNGFTQYSIAGTQVWDCTAFGRDPAAPAGTAAFPNAVQINGFANGINNRNIDWLISPKLDLSSTAFPLLNFWSRNAFAGDPLELKISTDYTGTGDPGLATWTDLNGKFPSQGSDVWTQSTNVNLSLYKQSSVYIAFVYTSTTDDGSRWTLDDISLVNSATPPPASLTLSTSNFSFGYAATGSTVTKKLTVTGNDLTDSITLSTAGGFLLSTDSVNFSTLAVLGRDTSNNTPETVFVRFSPAADNTLYVDSITVTTPDTTATVSIKGNSVDPSSTLSVVNWNLEWFGTPDPTLGVANKTLQEQNVGIILPSLHADLYALQEVVNDSAMRAIVATMPGYGYVINNYGSHSNVTEQNPTPLNQVQKLAFIYNMAKITNIQTDSLLSIGVNTAPDTATIDYNDWASGRFPYMLTADVTLSDNNGGSITKKIHFINIHGKANTSPILTAYARREHGAHNLDSLIQKNYIDNAGDDHNVIILGDFNDDLNKTITSTKIPPITSYHAFTSAAEDSADYITPTRALSLSGQHSDVNFTSVIDNVIATRALSGYYLGSSATVLSDVQTLVNKYGSTTTDHYPVLTQFSFMPPTPLPVKLTSFTGVREGEGARLNWSTSLESNSKLFQIERSGDGAHFLPIGTVAAQGNSHVLVRYTFLDDQPLPGTNYYRLRQVDLDGKADYSRVAVVDFSTRLRITPNPAHGTVYVTLGNTNGSALLSILDINGRTVLQQSVVAGAVNHPVDVSALSRGIYTVKVVSSSAMRTEKLLIR